MVYPMASPDLRTLCTALGFTAVVMKDNVPRENQASRAMVLAKMIEDFCVMAATNVFGVSQGNAANLDETIERLKSDLQSGRAPNIPHDSDLLRQLYLRLQQRHQIYATDDLIADEARHMLDEEVQLEAGGDMRVIDLCKQQATPHFGQHQSMATAIAEILATKGECYPDDLEAKGFDPEDIKQNWSIAYGLAKVESLLMQA